VTDPCTINSTLTFLKPATFIFQFLGVVYNERPTDEKGVMMVVELVGGPERQAILKWKREKHKETAKNACVENEQKNTRDTKQEGRSFQIVS